MIDISFDGVNLNATPYSIQEFPHESSAERAENLYTLARKRGAVAITQEYKEKIIVVQGSIRGSNLGDLDAKLDTLKEILARTGKNLDIDYSSGTRRYPRCYTRGISVTKRYPTIAKWSAAFVVPGGVGRATTQTVETESNVTDASYSGSVTIDGTTSPRPTFSVTFDSLTGTTTVELTIGGYKITYDNDTALSASDEIIFDFENEVVTKNGTEVAYQGVFPEWSIGSNGYVVDTDGSARQYDIEIAYYPTYL